MKEYYLDIFGRVQGVNFRNMVKRYCDSNKLFGRVMNCDDGRVFVIVQTDKLELNNFLRWLDSNPGMSKVDRIVLEGSENIKKRYSDFNVIKEKGILKDKGKAVKNLFRRILNGK